MNNKIIVKKVYELPNNLNYSLVKPENLEEILEELQKEGKDATTLLLCEGKLYETNEINEEELKVAATLNIEKAIILPFPYITSFGWDYPLEEIDYLLDQIEDGDREDNYTMLLHDSRLYELS